jgi:hypothetical protein
VSWLSSSRKNEHESPFRRLPRHHAHPEHGFVADIDIVFAHVSRHFRIPGLLGAIFRLSEARRNEISLAADPLAAKMASCLAATTIPRLAASPASACARVVGQRVELKTDGIGGEGTA